MKQRHEHWVAEKRGSWGGSQNKASNGLRSSPSQWKMDDQQRNGKLRLRRKTGQHSFCNFQARLLSDNSSTVMTRPPCQQHQNKTNLLSTDFVLGSQFSWGAHDFAFGLTSRFSTSQFGLESLQFGFWAHCLVLGALLGLRSHC